MLGTLDAAYKCDKGPCLQLIFDLQIFGGKDIYIYIFSLI